jgi:hypothetical protein
MLLFDLLAEQRIAEAIARGELENLPGAGRPLDLGDDALIPEDLRMVYRILRNAGFVPPEVEVLREIGELERCIETLSAGEARNAAWRKLQMLRARIEAYGMRRHGLPREARYTQCVMERFAGSPASTERHGM